MPEKSRRAMRCILDYLPYPALICFTLILLLLSACSRPTEQARALRGGAMQSLIDLGHCDAIRHCDDMIEVITNHNRIIVALYDLGQRDMLRDCIEYIVGHGFAVTGGIPVMVKIYPRPVGNYENRMFPGKRAVTEIEITG